MVGSLSLRLARLLCCIVALSFAAPCCNADSPIGSLAPRGRVLLQHTPRTAAGAADADARSLRHMKSAIIRHVPASSLHVSKPTWWLTSRFHFSFADYWSPERTNFGALRVVNDDLVMGQAGFGTHPHRDAEIFSYVLDGHLTHADSMGNRESLSRGGVQYMSAGTGVTHSEMNDHPETCRFIQIWITPDRRGHTPQYGSSTYEPAERRNRLLRILGGTGAAPAWPGLHTRDDVALHADANVVVSESDAETAFDLPLAPARQAYLLCMEGALTANGQRLGERDAAQVIGDAGAPTRLEITALEGGAHFLLVEMAKAQ